MPLFFAGLSSLSFGVADFFGGFVTRRAPVLTVVTNAQFVGAVVMVVVAPLVSEPPTMAAVWWGVGSGVAGSAGLVVFYHALATTRMSVAAPVAAVVGTVLPVVFGVVIGERPAPVAWVGMLLAIPAVVLLSTVRHDSGSPARAALLGAVAGVAFALFGILISRTGVESGMWPLAAARVGSVVLLAGAALALGRPVVAARPEWGLIALSGALDIAGNVLFLVAVREELLSLVAVIMSLYPATTIALARMVLGEHVVRRQWLGLGAAALSVVLIASG